MKITPFALITPLVLIAGIACANPVFAHNLTKISNDDPFRHHDSITYDFSGYHFNDAQGSALNEVFTTDFLPFILVTGVSWDVNLTTIGASWASEATINIAGLFHINVSDDANPVTNQNYTSNGVFEFSDNGIDDIENFGAPQLFNIEFFESFVDNGGTGDAFFEAGSTITFHGKFLPTPGTLAIFVFGGLAATRRRR
ncbi:MAG: hypothetical protein ACWA5W_03100 [Phycisphaerales bacterium]